jgi:hypothetical protein
VFSFVEFIFVCFGHFLDEFFVLVVDFLDQQLGLLQLVKKLIQVLRLSLQSQMRLQLFNLQLQFKQQLEIASRQLNSLTIKWQQLINQFEALLNFQRKPL